MTLRLPSLCAVILTALALLPTRQGSPLLIEFSYRDTTSDFKAPVSLLDCSYHLLLTGSSSHTGGFRIGVEGWRSKDTVTVRILGYRASDVMPRNWRAVAWELRVGGLQPGTYHLVLLGSDTTVLFKRAVKVITNTDLRTCAA